MTQTSEPQTYERSQLGESELKEVMMSAGAMGIVFGIVVGLIIATKPVLKGVAIAIGAGSAVGTATYLLLDYRHVDRRNALHATIHQLTTQNTQLQRDCDQAMQATKQLQSERDHVQSQFNQLATVAEREQVKLQARLDAAIATQMAPPLLEDTIPLLQPQDHIPPVPVAA
jgi:hypothetical protein